LLAVALFLFGSIFVIIGVLAGISAVGAAALTGPSETLAVAGRVFSLLS
jgi:hypothetical protein